MRKERRKRKKRIKRDIEESVKEAVRYNKYTYLFEELGYGKELFDVFSSSMSSVEKNERINEYSNILSSIDEPDYDLLVREKPLFGKDIEGKYGSFLKLNNEMVVLYCIMPEKGEDLYGKNINQIIDEFCKNRYYHGGRFILSSRFDCDLYESNVDYEDLSKTMKDYYHDYNEHYVKKKVLKLTKRYDFIVLNKWTRCFWYRDWLEEVCLQDGMLYTPTIEIK